MASREVEAIEATLQDHWAVLALTWNGFLPSAVGWYTQDGACGRSYCGTCRGRPESEHPQRNEFWDQVEKLEGAAETVQETYAQPEDGWTCFHCGERFTSFGSAQDHFGARPDNMAACLIKVGTERGLVMALRRAEAELRELKYNECSVCGQTMLTGRGLARHKWLAHQIRGKDKPWEG